MALPRVLLPLVVRVVLVLQLATPVLSFGDSGGALEAVPTAPELQAQLNAAIAKRSAAFTIPPGLYNFTRVNFNISGAANFRVVAAGVTVLFGGTAGVNISNSENVHISGLSINYYNPPHGRLGVPGITYNLLNCTDVVSEDITIYKAPFFSVTAFNGGGGHVFRRFHLPNDTTTGPSGKPSDPWPHQRDAFHFTDLRRGVLLEDSIASGFGDDFFNSHNTIMLVLERESPTSLLVINPHLQNVRKAPGCKGPLCIITNKNTVYGTNCVLENLRSGDEVHFFAMPECTSQNGGGSKAACTEEEYTPAPQGSEACVVKGAPQVVTDASTLLAAFTLANETYFSKEYTMFDATDIWRVEFSAALPAAVGRASLVNIDSFSTPGTIIRNNTFSHTKYNLGRFKSNGGQIINNRFSHAGAANLEISPLLQFFEGNLPVVRDVLVSGNTITGEGVAPIHCSTMCGRDTPNSTNTKCPLCGRQSSFTSNVSVVGNTIVPASNSGGAASQ